MEAALLHYPRGGVHQPPVKGVIDAAPGLGDEDGADELVLGIGQPRGRVPHLFLQLGQARPNLHLAVL